MQICGRQNPTSDDLAQQYDAHPLQLQVQMRPEKDIFSALAPGRVLVSLEGGLD
jgi:hypothetical protein